MYHIEREKSKPDIKYMEDFVKNISKRGIKIYNCTELRNKYLELRDALELDFKYKYNVNNPGSPKQVVEFIKHLANKVEMSSKNDIINICYVEDTGKWTTEASAMEKLADLGYEFARDLLDYRHAKKYAESLTSIIEATDENSLIHPNVSLTKTNRVSYSEPALMNIPKKLLWSVVGPYKENNSLYSVDIKNQEPHILISMTGAKELEQALMNTDGLYETMFKQCFKPTVTANILIDTLPENKIYSVEELRKIGTVSPALYSAVKPQISSFYYNGVRVTEIETICIGSEKGIVPKLPSTINIELEDGSIRQVEVEWEDIKSKRNRNNDYTAEGTLKGIDIDISKAERKEFKTSWLAISYGCGFNSVNDTCKIIDGKRVWNYITNIEAIKKYRKQIESLAYHGVNTIGTVFGNRLYTGIDSYDRNKLKRVLLDLPIQGTGADILSLLIKRFEDYTQEKDLGNVMNIYYTRHDELIIEVDRNWELKTGEDKVKDVLNDMLEHQIDNWVPFKIEITKVENENIELNVDEEE